MHIDIILCEWYHPNQNFLLTCIIKVNERSCRLRMGAYRDGVNRKGDKIGMEL